MSLTLLVGAGCYRTKPTNGTLDLTDVPERVAKVFPIQPIPFQMGVHPVSAISPPYKITLTNFGPYPASALAASADNNALEGPFSFSGEQGFPGQDGTCTDTLEPEQSCDLFIVYEPASVGPHTGVLRLSYINGAARMPLEIELRGTTPAEMVFDVPLLDFGVVPVTGRADATVLVTNAGGTPASLTGGQVLTPEPGPAPDVFGFSAAAAPGIQGQFPGLFGNCSLTLPIGPGQSCALGLTFSPNAAQAFNGYDFELSFNDGIGARGAILGLTGSGQ